MAAGPAAPTPSEGAVASRTPHASLTHSQVCVGGGLEISTTRRSGRSSLLRNSSQFDIDIN